jgi:hypothetical protein
MICFEKRPEYKMKGCDHTICTVCADQMKDMPSSIVYPFSNIFTVKCQGVSCLRCPYCRTREPVHFNHQIMSYKSFKKSLGRHLYLYFCNRTKNHRLWTFSSYDDYIRKQDAYIKSAYKSYKFNINNIIKKEYNLWLQLELSYDGVKSRINMNYNDYYNGKNRPYIVTWTIYRREDSISIYEFRMETPSKYQKHLDGNPLRPQKYTTSPFLKRSCKTGNLRGH